MATPTKPITSTISACFFGDHGRQLAFRSFVKAKKFQNGHPGNSTPLDEQTWLVTAVNAIENSKYWDDTAIIITYDDSDGWYDHQMDPIVNQSSSRKR